MYPVVHALHHRQSGRIHNNWDYEPDAHCLVATVTIHNERPVVVVIPVHRFMPAAFSYSVAIDDYGVWWVSPGNFSPALPYLRLILYDAPADVTERMKGMP